ncbi:MAG: ABC transporter ATP-binding protein [Lachnospiraceae bacterium]|nr:ABC transporter ATP-binding protein [Lachnospiraceae bacterium]
MNLIAASHIQSSYGKKHVLSDVNIEIGQGSCVGIIGANGCGKSTLLAILAGIRTPAGGSIFYCGQEVTGRAAWKRYRRAIGYVPQRSILMPELTVWDNLLLWYVDRKLLRQELETGFLGELGLGEMCRMKVGQLSGGMEKRLSIGAALANRPGVLILDEPSAALDMPGKRDVRMYLEKFRQWGGTVIFTTHDESELELCSKLYVLAGGTCREADPEGKGAMLWKTI